MYSILFLLSISAAVTRSMLKTDVTPAEIDKTMSGTVNSTMEVILEYTLPRDVTPESALRIYVESPRGPQEATNEHPLIVVVRHNQGVLSWQIPFKISTDVNADGENEVTDYYWTNRTLCPAIRKTASNSSELIGPIKASKDEHVYVSLSTSSPENTEFIVRLFEQETFKIEMKQEYESKVSPSAPIFYYFKHPEDVKYALFKITSQDRICMTLSLQNITCPVRDLDRNVKFEGMYQTMDLKTGLTFTQEEFPFGVFIIFIAHSDDIVCRSGAKLNPKNFNCAGGPCREKHVTFSIESKITRTEYLAATFGAFGMFLGAYIFVFLISFVLFIREATGVPENQIHDQQSIEEQRGEEEAGEQTQDVDANALDPEAVAECAANTASALDQIDRVSEPSSIEDADVDFLRDAETEKEVVRTKNFLFVCDLARKSPKALEKKSQLYHWNLLTIAIFYGLPVIQLMLTYQTVTNTTGNQDLCYYNFLCAHPLGLLSDFNHVFSNLGYVLLGLLFMMIVWRRSVSHRKMVRGNGADWERLYGIPKHYGMFYAMGLALIMEGILSGCYHICPSHVNFQFDTAFMYTISILILLKIYQTRHPDINANAYTAFGTLAFVIFVGVIGVLHGNLYFWIFFTIVHIIACLTLSVQVYYMGRFKVNSSVFKRAWEAAVNDARSLCSGNICALKPQYMDRFILLIAMNIINWSFSGYGVSHLGREGGDFASFLLAIFIANVLSYTVYYILMKLRHREKITIQPAVYILISCFSWAGALYFFLNKSTTWVLTPAQSRHYNQECKLFHFYDNHDIWHFLSASSLFLSFMILLTLDDGLDNVRRDKIPVF